MNRLEKSNHRDYCGIFRIFFQIKIHWKRIPNAELNALIEYVSSHSSEPNWKNTSIHTDSNANSYIFPIFVDIKIHCKSISNASLDVEFNSLKQYAVLIQGADWKRGENSEKRTSNHADDYAIPYSFRIFLDIKIHCKSISNASISEEFNAAQRSVIR